MTMHMTGDSEVERDLRKMKTAPQALTERTMKDIMRDELGAPTIVDRSTFQAELDALRVREKAHTREGDAIAATRRRLPMVEVDGATMFILATSPTPRFATARTKRASGTATSWAGRCLGTRPRTRSTPSWLDAGRAGCTSFATCDKDPMSSRLTG